MEEKEEKLTPGQKKVKGILERLAEWFTKSKEKEISHIRVNNTRQTFWVNNPKKIRYWMNLAEKAGKTAFQSGGSSPSIQILKVVYK